METSKSMIHYEKINSMPRSLSNGKSVSMAGIAALGLLIGIVCATAAQATEFTIPRVEIHADQPVIIPLVIDKADALAGIKVVLSYDAKILKYTEARKTEATAGLMHIVNDKNPGRLIIVMAGAKGISGKDLTLMKVVFAAAKSPKTETRTELKVVELQLMNDQLKTIDAKISVQPVRILPAATAN